MKNMRRILALLLALMMVFALAACGGNTEETTTGDKTASDSKAEFETVEKGKLIMATNAEFPPYEYYEGEKIVGIDAEVAALIAEKLGLELEIEDVAFDSIIPGVQQGKYDMGMAGMTIDEDRIQKVNFSTSYAKGVQVVIVKSGSDIKTLDDIEGKEIGVQQGTTGDMYATGDYGEEAITRYENGAVAVEALKKGKVDCVIIDNEPAKAYVAANEGLEILDTEYTNEDYAICFAKDNTELQKAVNDALEELIADGSLQKIVDKYIKADNAE